MRWNEVNQGMFYLYLFYEVLTKPAKVRDLWNHVSLIIGSLITLSIVGNIHIFTGIISLQLVNNSISSLDRTEL